MFVHRFFILIATCFVLAGCEMPQLLETGAGDKYSVNKLTVNTSGLARVGGRVNKIQAQRVHQDVKANVETRIRRRARGPQPVNVHVDVDSVYLVSPGQSFLVGGVSTLRGAVKVTDAKTGSVILPSTPVLGTAKGTYAPGGLIGVLTTRSVENDYLQTVAGFGADLERQLFGDVQRTAVRVKSESEPASTDKEVPPEEEARLKAQAERNADLARCRRAITNKCLKKKEYLAQ